ncbi:putative disease resistance protein RGA4 [Carex rostrata]
MDPVTTTAAISWSFSAARWLISPVLRLFLNKFFDALPPKFQSRKETLRLQLEKLQATILPQLLILTDAAQQSPHRPFLEKWLQNLKSAFYEAEHVLGLVEYQRLETEVNSLFPSTSKFDLKNLKSKLPEFSSEKKNLIKSLEKLEKIVNQAMEFVSLLSLPSSSVNNSTWEQNEQYRETISVPGSTVIGREKDRDEIVKLLRENFPESSSNAKCYSVIGIWGMGGLGKTTLAQYVCDHEREDKYFDRVIWAHVSQKFSVHTILKAIWESAFKETCPSFDKLEGLQSKLEEKLRGERYFLVLDDVWCDKGVSEQELEQLFVPLRAGKGGSKILVTTRIEAAAKALGAVNPIPLRELDDEQFMSLFISNAIDDAQISDNHMKERLLSIGKKIAEKLHRSPLAAKTVARQLRRKLDPKFWSSMLEKTLLHDTMGALLLSYQHLSPPVQRCFAFCSLFSKGAFLNHDHLINLWIAEGFIETEGTNEHMKDIANWYISELISSSFFQDVKEGSKVYIMHDLMHDLAKHVSESECFIIEEGNEKEIPKQTRHISVVDNMIGEYVEKICKLEDLCTLVVRRSFLPDISLKEVDLDALFTKSSKLYVVDIQWAIVERFPKSAVQLRNLRYLKFVTTEEDAIPESLNRLYQLRVLSISKSWSYRGRLAAIPYVGRLILLQDLEVFHVQTKRGFELKQLEHLRDLFGSLSIYDLHNVESKEEAYQAKLSEKKGIQNLHFYWDYGSKDVMREVDVDILEGLCPPPEIEAVTIKGYSGEKFPSWILKNHDNIIHLNHLELSNCPRLKIWEPLPLNLTQLKIFRCLSLAFVSKEDLEMVMSIRNTIVSQIVNFLENLVDRQENSCVKFLGKLMLGGDIGDQTYSTTLNDLKKFIEKRLDLISELKDTYNELSLPVRLMNLSIKSCFITDKILARSLQVLTTLTHLELEDIITITCIAKEVLSSLTSIMDLKIRGCLLLTSIGGLDAHSTLVKFKIECCPVLTFEIPVVANSSNTVESTSSSLAGRKTKSSILKYVSLRGCLPPYGLLQDLVSLENLVIWDCPTIINLQISHLKLLVELKIGYCPNIVSLRGLNELNNLKYLEVVGCEKLKCYSDADKVPKLEWLSISRWSLAEQLVSRDGLSSLVSLELRGSQEEYFSQEEFEVFHCLSSLEVISFCECKMHILPNLLFLHSLRDLFINVCKNLTSLQELPPSVQCIDISGCNEVFTRSCKDPSDPNWQKISHIPKKFIR